MKDQNTPTNTLEDIFKKRNPTGYELGHFNKHIIEIESLISEAVNKARIEELNTLYATHNRYFDKDSCELIKDRIRELETPNQVEQIKT